MTLRIGLIARLYPLLFFVVTFFQPRSGAATAPRNPVTDAPLTGHHGIKDITISLIIITLPGGGWERWPICLANYRIETCFGGHTVLKTSLV